MSTPACFLKSSPKRWSVEPTPPEPKLNLPGWVLSRATSSGSVLALIDALIATTFGTLPISMIGAKSRFMSKLGLVEKYCIHECSLKPDRSVYPSGRDLATYSVAIAPPAPGLFSTTTGLFQISDSFCAIARAMVSAAPPAEGRQHDRDRPGWIVVGLSECRSGHDGGAGNCSNAADKQLQCDSHASSSLGPLGQRTVDICGAHQPPLARVRRCAAAMVPRRPRAHEGCDGAHVGGARQIQQALEEQRCASRREPQAGALQELFLLLVAREGLVRTSLRTLHFLRQRSAVAQSNQDAARRGPDARHGGVDLQDDARRQGRGRALRSTRACLNCRSPQSP